MSSDEFFRFDVFLSHASEDKEDVRELARALRSVGLRPWVDEERMAPGSILKERIKEGLRQSRHLLMWVTEAWKKKDYTQWELELFS